MTLPESPSPFRSPPPIERPWWWRLEDAAGNEVTLSGAVAEEYGEQRFPSQGDAESWVGEAWPALLELGVAQVTLFELERKVYGPMKLSA
jgi:hypothetical protein